MSHVLRANWTDLMMWGVLSGQHDLAEALWEKTSDPVRAALMASQLCRRLKDEPQLRADMDALQRASEPRTHTAHTSEWIPCGRVHTAETPRCAPARASQASLRALRDVRARLARCGA